MSDANAAPNTNLDHWVGTKALAEFLGCSQRTVEGWRRAGVGPPGSRLSSGQYRYRLSDADAWLRSKRMSATE